MFFFIVMTVSDSRRTLQLQGAELRFEAFSKQLAEIQKDCPNPVEFTAKERLMLLNFIIRSFPVKISDLSKKTDAQTTLGVAFVTGLCFCSCSIPELGGLVSAAQAYAEAVCEDHELYMDVADRILAKY